MHSDVIDGVRQLSGWLRNNAWPAWLAHGIDRGRGGFFESLDLESKTCGADFRRLRVVARQTYVMAQAHRAGVPGAAGAVQIGLYFLEHHAPHPAGGYAWRFDLNHAPIDHTRDFYDHAFVLLALAGATSVVPAETIRPKALGVLNWIETFLPHPAGGYLESVPPTLPRRQNPHMHYLEALLAAYEAFGDAVFLDRAKDMIDLFATRLFDPACGALPEFFDDALIPLRRNGAFIVEPGHHCEWVWLLHRFQALAGLSAPLAEIAAKLMAFVDRFGLDPGRGDVIDMVDSRGETLEGTGRLWPQTERLKAEFLRPNATDEKRLAAIHALLVYLRPDGLWHERRGADGVFLHAAAPASSLYHLTAAICAIEKEAVLF